MRLTVTINANGLRVGEDHQNAKLTDAEVDRIRELHEAGNGYRRLAKMFEVSKTTIRLIVKCERRAQCAIGYREVHVPD